MRRFLSTATAALMLVVAAAQPARAQTSAPPQPPSTARAHATAGARVKHTLVFLGGAASGLVVHESGHLLFGAAFGAHPRVHALTDSPVPFFKIQHDQVSRRKEFVISSAGLWMQYAGSEWLLTARPHLRDEHAPFLKGMFAFDLGTSTLYAITAFARAGASERDTRGMAASLGRQGVAEPVVGALVLAPAVLDAYRYLRPGARWPTWASRGVKIASVALVLAAGR